MKIFLDDDPRRDNWVDDTWTIVRTARDCLALIGHEPIEILSLDHDLGEPKHVVGSGYEVMATLEHALGTGLFDKEDLPQRFEIHSANPVGRKNMQAAIDSIERMRNVS